VVPIARPALLTRLSRRSDPTNIWSGLELTRFGGHLEDQNVNQTRGRPTFPKSARRVHLAFIYELSRWAGELERRPYDSGR